VDLSDVAARLRSFAAEREWDKFHDPKNLAMALAAEAGVLLEVFQWKTTEEVRNDLDPDEVAAASEELADVLIFLVRLADVLDIDLGDAVDRKIAINADRYPVEVAKGERMESTSLCRCGIPSRVWQIVQ
jgi:NTP pyrophosphatase (non-canonical NTP hydrolase)